VLIKDDFLCHNVVMIVLKLFGFSTKVKVRDNEDYAAML